MSFEHSNLSKDVFYYILSTIDFSTGETLSRKKEVGLDVAKKTAAQRPLHRIKDPRRGLSSKQLAVLNRCASFRGKNTRSFISDFIRIKENAKSTGTAFLKQLSLDVLYTFMANYTVFEAAALLGVGASTLRVHVRTLGIDRWLYRKAGSPFLNKHKKSFLHPSIVRSNE